MHGAQGQHDSTKVEKLMISIEFGCKYAFIDIISRASSSDVLVNFFHKSSKAISIPLDVIHKFYKMTFYFVNLLLDHGFHYVFFLLLYSYFRGFA